MSDLSQFDGGEPVYRDTRAQAFADGRLVDLSADFDAVAKSLGIVPSVAMTSAAFDAAVWPTTANVRSPRSPDRLLELGERLGARAGRVLQAYAHCVRRQHGRIDGAIFPFALTVRDSADDWREIDLWAICLQGDHGEPVLTIALPDEDSIV